MFYTFENQAHHSIARNYSPPKAPGITTSMEVEEAELELGWVTDPQTSSAKRTSNKKGTNIAVNNKDHEGSIKVSLIEYISGVSQILQKRKELLFELKGRLERDTHLRYALRELEMQRALMGKGASRKLHGPELIKPDGQADDELDEDEQDALFGQRRKIKPKCELFRANSGMDTLLIGLATMTYWITIGNDA